MIKNYFKTIIAAIALAVSANAAATTYWLSGGYNGWSTADADEYAFYDNGDGTHTLTLETFYGEFKIITTGGAAWYGYGTIELDTEYTISTSLSSNIGLPSTSDTYTNVEFTVTEASDGTLTLKVTSDGSAATAQVFYLSGVMNSWAQLDEDYQFTDNGDGTHTLTTAAFSTSILFKVMTNLGNWYGYGSMDLDTEYTVTTTGDNCYLASEPSTDYLLLTITEGDAITLKVSEVASNSISAVAAEAPLTTTYYSLTGAQVAQPKHGVFIVVKSFADGTTTATKVMK